MRQILVLMVVLAWALAPVAFAQVERDPASRHSSGTADTDDPAASTARPFMPESEPAPVQPEQAPAEPDRALMLVAWQMGEAITELARSLPAAAPVPGATVTEEDASPEREETADIVPAAPAPELATEPEPATPVESETTSGMQSAPETEVAPAPEPVSQPAAEATDGPEPSTEQAPSATEQTLLDEPAPEPLTAADDRVVVETSELLRDEPEADAALAPEDSAAGNPAGEYPPMRPLRSTSEAPLASGENAASGTGEESNPEAEPATELSGKSTQGGGPAQESESESASEPEPPQETEPALEPEPSPGSEPTHENESVSSRRLIPDRRRLASELLGRDGSTGAVQRNQPVEPAPALTPEVEPQPAPATHAGMDAIPNAKQDAAGTSLAQITGEPSAPPQLPASQPSSSLISAAVPQATVNFSAPAAVHEAPVALVLPDGTPQMPHYDVPASLKVLKRGNPKEKLVALTFDDGPHPEYTSQLLAVLDYYDVPATFFCVGIQAQKYPQWVKMINQQGHEVASHTYDHFRLPKLPRTEKEYQIDEYQRLIESLIGVTPRFLRPPGGQDDAETEQLLAQRKMVMAMWDVAINDTSHGKLEQDLLKVSLEKVRPGSVLLAHDGVQATIDMLPELIQSLRAKGYRFVTLSELAAGA